MKLVKVFAVVMSLCLFLVVLGCSQESTTDKPAGTAEQTAQPAQPAEQGK